MLLLTCPVEQRPMLYFQLPTRVLRGWVGGWVGGWKSSYLSGGAEANAVLPTTHQGVERHFWGGEANTQGGDGRLLSHD